MTFPIVPQNDALAAIAVRDEQVDCSIAVEVGRHDGCCRFCRERFAGGKVALAVVQADVTRRGDFGAFAAVGDHDVRIAVAVQVGQCHITRGPVRVAECTGLGEVSSSVIQVDKLAIRRIVADDNVQVAVAIDVCQGRGIGSIRSGAEVARGETALAIIQQHQITDTKLLTDRFLMGYEQLLRPKLVIGIYKPWQRNPELLLDEITDIAKKTVGKWALTGTAAAFKSQGFYRGHNTTIFIDELPPIMIEQLRLLPSATGPVTFLRTFGELVVDRETAHLPIANPWLVYAELRYDRDPRAQEAADMYWTKHLTNHD